MDHKEAHALMLHALATGNTFAAHQYAAIVRAAWSK